MQKSILFLNLVLTFSALSLGSLETHAEGWDGDCAPMLAPFKFEKPEARQLAFKDVEVFRQNNNWGQQQVGTITFNEWFDLPSPNSDTFNYVGLTPQGDIYHLVHIGGRNVARLLNGRRQFKKILLFEGGILVALDTKARVFVYSAAQWGESPKSKVIKTAVASWAALNSALLGTLALLAPDIFSYGPELSGFHLSIPVTMLSLASALNGGFISLYKFEHLNTFPDGFVYASESLLQLNSLGMRPSSLDYDYPEFFFKKLPASVPEASEPIR